MNMTTKTHQRVHNGAAATRRAIMLRSLAIVLVTAVVAVGYAAVRGVPWRPDVEALIERGEQHSELRATIGVSLAEFLDLIEQGAIVLDTRSTEAFAEGRLASSRTLVLNIPADEIDAHLVTLEDYRGSTFVLYCTSNQCDLSEEVYLAMIDAGFDPVLMHIYFPGWEGIQEAGLDVESDYTSTATGEPMES